MSDFGCKKIEGSKDMCYNLQQKKHIACYDCICVFRTTLFSVYKGYLLHYFRLLKVISCVAKIAYKILLHINGGRLPHAVTFIVLPVFYFSTTHLNVLDITPFKFTFYKSNIDKIKL